VTQPSFMAGFCSAEKATGVVNRDVSVSKTIARRDGPLQLELGDSTSKMLSR
jgi:hypothetical protein